MQQTEDTARRCPCTNIVRVVLDVPERNCRDIAQAAKEKELRDTKTRFPPKFSPTEECGDSLCPVDFQLQSAT
jgi:hypothetical protein